MKLDEPRPFVDLQKSLREQVQRKSAGYESLSELLDYPSRLRDAVNETSYLRVVEEKGKLVVKK
ncbi:hypothetical protein AAVH_41506, partial [Aphelenchoides avenae]